MYELRCKEHFDIEEFHSRFQMWRFRNNGLCHGLGIIGELSTSKILCQTVYLRRPDNKHFKNKFYG